MDVRNKIGQRIDTFLSSPRTFGVALALLVTVIVFVSVVNFHSTSFRGTTRLFCGVVSSQVAHCNTSRDILDKQQSGKDESSTNINITIVADHLTRNISTSRDTSRASDTTTVIDNCTITTKSTSVASSSTTEHFPDTETSTVNDLFTLTDITSTTESSIIANTSTATELHTDPDNFTVADVEKDSTTEYISPVTYINIPQS